MHIKISLNTIVSPAYLIRAFLVACLAIVSSDAAYASDISGFLSTMPVVVLPAGTTQASGSIGYQNSNYFEFEGLLAGSNFELHVFSTSGTDSNASADLYDNTSVMIGSGPLDGTGVYFTSVVPPAGSLILNIYGNTTSQFFPYEADLNAEQAPVSGDVPEPATLVITGGALVVILACCWRRDKLFCFPKMRS